MTDKTTTEFMSRLCAPIPQEQVKHRSQGGFNLSYITARTVMNRLDNVAGVLGWYPVYEKFGENAVLCILHVGIPTEGGTVAWISKQGVGGYTNMQDAGDSEKSAESDALKRAGVCLGIGRELYGEGTPEWTEKAPGQPSPEPNPPRPYPNPKPTGTKFQMPPLRAAFPFIRDLEAYYKMSFLKLVNDDAKSRGFPTRTTDWTLEQMHILFSSLIRYIRGEVPTYAGELDGIDLSKYIEETPFD